MAFVKRIAFFLLMNLAMMVMIGFIVYLIERFTGFRLTPNMSGGYFALLGYCALLGFSGAFISLLISRPMAKWSHGIVLMSESRLMDYSPKEQLVYTTVARIAKGEGISIPEVGIYDSVDPNAFATGARKNASLVAVSTGLLDTMTPSEIEGVVAHEMAHILNGDMITMTLLQGVMNTFVYFLARVAAYGVSLALKKDDEGTPWYEPLIAFFFEIVLGLLATLVLMAYSRKREYRADEGSAKYVGKEKMIQALKRLQTLVERTEQCDNGKLATFKIASKSSFISLFSSHPDLSDRIKNLESNYSI